MSDTLIEPSADHLTSQNAFISILVGVDGLRNRRVGWIRSIDFNPIIRLPLSLSLSISLLFLLANLITIPGLMKLPFYLLFLCDERWIEPFFKNIFTL